MLDILRRLASGAFVAVLAVSGFTTVMPSPAEAVYPCTTRVAFSDHHFTYSLTGRGARSGIYYFEGVYGRGRHHRDRYYSSRNPYPGARRGTLHVAFSQTYTGGRWITCKPFDPTP